MGIPIAKTVYEHLPVIDSETWEDQDLLIGSGRRPKKAKKKKKKIFCERAGAEYFPVASKLRSAPRTGLCEMSV